MGVISLALLAQSTVSIYNVLFIFRAHHNYFIPTGSHYFPSPTHEGVCLFMETMTNYVSYAPVDEHNP